MTEYRYTAADLAGKVGLKTARAARERANELKLGIDLRGRAGKRYSDADVARLLESMRPQPEVKKRDRRGRHRAA